MRGTVVMRYVGNRQEPEEEPVERTPLVLFAEGSKFLEEMNAWMEAWREEMVRLISVQMGCRQTKPTAELVKAHNETKIVFDAEVGD